MCPLSVLNNWSRRFEVDTKASASTGIGPTVPSAGSLLTIPNVLAGLLCLLKGQLYCYNICAI
jgi:hypothetical protein